MSGAYPDGVTGRDIDDVIQDDDCPSCGVASEEPCLEDCYCYWCVTARDKFGERVDAEYLEYKDEQIGAKSWDFSQPSAFSWLALYSFIRASGIFTSE